MSGRTLRQVELALADAMNELDRAHRELIAAQEHVRRCEADVAELRRDREAMKQDAAAASAAARAQKPASAQERL